MRQCEIDGCERKHRARGMCKMHYHRWREGFTGTLLDAPPDRVVIVPASAGRPLVPGEVERTILVDGLTGGFNPRMRHETYPQCKVETRGWTWRGVPCIDLPRHWGLVK